jgi:tetratricopeptide (TPR) repeat protein
MFRAAFFRLSVLLSVVIFIPFPVLASISELDQIQIAPPMTQVQSPPENASAEELEKRGDELRGRKQYLDAIDYYHAARKKAAESAPLFNKIGIAELMLQRYKDAGKSFEQAIKKDRRFGEAYNNLGVIQYERHKYGAAVKQYKKALELQPQSASFYSNLGAAYFARKEFEHASQAYAQAVRLDPEIFERTSHTGIAAQMASPEDRAHYDYVVAKLYAKMGDRDRSFQFLRKAMEDGYKGLKDVYTDPEFAELRADARFAELMKAKSPIIPE